MKEQDIQRLTEAIREVPDFPRKGIVFKDITTLVKDADLLALTADLLYEHYKDSGITKVAGIESRGFILGAILAYRLGAGFVLMRKAGKLPADTYAQQYQLEYGSDTLELHQDALSRDDVVLLHDDLLATGGSAEAAAKLINKFDVHTLMINFLIELEFLNGKKRLQKYGEIFSLIKY